MDRSTTRLSTAALVAALLFCAAAYRLAAQQQQPPAEPPAAPSSSQAAGTSDEDWKPEKLTNLKVLPKTTTPDEIMTIMRGFTEALNVGCIFCHKGKLNAPLSTFDFADDSKEHKEVTRSMIQMTNDINTKYPEGMGDASLEEPKVTCATCHRRNRHPEIDLPPKEERPRG
ncbi:MAG TPA: c-type cytochrome [Vicinamibacterales bacterium]